MAEKYYSTIQKYQSIFLPEITKCMYFCVIRQENELTNKNSTVTMKKHLLFEDSSKAMSQ